jgi:hypothetical protein
MLLKNTFVLLNDEYTDSTRLLSEGALYCMLILTPPMHVKPWSIINDECWFPNTVV